MKYNISGRGLASAAHATAAAAALCFAVSSAVMAADQSLTNAPAMTPTPSAAPAKGEFDNYGSRNRGSRCKGSCQGVHRR